MNNFLRYCFFCLIVRPVIKVILGLNIQHRDRLPIEGPAIIVANHNSHLDTMVLMALFPLSLLNKIHPVAASDYFLKNKFLAWFSQRIIGIIPINRTKAKSKAELFAPIEKSLNDDNIVIYFPEGSRGDPEKMSDLKKGIGHLASQNPSVPIYPIFMHGLGKALPKNEALLVPFVVNLVIGEPLYFSSSPNELVNELHEHFEKIREELVVAEWD